MASFLGVDIGGGVGDAMQARLDAVQAQMQAAFTGDPTPAKPVTGDPALTLAEWSGVRAVGGIREDAGPHTEGVAIDINYDTQPYIVTCSLKPGAAFDDIDKWRFGGEKAGHALLAERTNACAVYERALLFRGIDPPEPGVYLQARLPGESTGGVYDRFRVVSDALHFYLSFAFRDDWRASNGDRILRRAVVTNRNFDIREAIPASERLPQDMALSQIEGYVTMNDYQRFHPGTTNSVAMDVYIQMLWDFEQVRIPMLVGKPAAGVAPTTTRNPVFGFLDLRRDLVIALCDPGIGAMRWGACDFGKVETSPNENGDMMHFDLRAKAVAAPA